ncbi:MAG TPA: hypothetical protein PK514_05465 [Spirochaetota bacterium]|nr:hypothetical protein [Spirochaetota bacterium]
MKVFMTIILGMIPVMLGASDRFTAESPLLTGDSSFLIAKSDTTSDKNNNMTIVFPAGEDDQEESAGEEQDNKPAEAGTWKKGFELETNFNTKDWMLGLGLGMQHTSGISLLLRFQIRPLTNTVFVEKSASAYRQYNERRMVLGLSASWDYMIVQPVGIYINAGYGVSFAYFRGSDENPETIWTPMAGGGLLLQPWETTSLRFGYEYIRTPQYPDHHINISSMLMF